MTEVPSPTRVSIRMPPPDCFAKPRTWLNPSPEPLPISLVVKNGSKALARTSFVMPEPVSVTVIVTYSPAGGSSDLSGGPTVELAVSNVTLPPICIASRALIARFSTMQLYLRGIGERMPQSRSKYSVDFDAAGHRALKQIAHARECLIEIDGPGLKTLAARECEQLRRELGPALSRQAHVRKPLPQFCVGETGRASFNKADVSEHHSEQIVEIMGNARCELADCLQPLHLAERRFDALALFDLRDKLPVGGRQLSGAFGDLAF